MGEPAALACALIWALTTIFMRFGALRMSVLWLNAMRSLFGVVALIALLLALPNGISRLQSLPPSAIFWLSVSTVLGLAIGDTLYFVSSQMIGVARSMPLSGWHPLVTVLVAAILLGEALSWRVAAAAILILGGIYLLAIPQGQPVVRNDHLTNKHSFIGVLMAGAAAVCWGLSVVGQKLALYDPNVDLMAANVVRLSLGTLFLFVLALLGGGKVGWHRLESGFIVLLVIVGGIGGVVSPYLWLYAIQQAGASKVALLSSTSPIFGLPLSVILLRERVTYRTAAGTLLAVLGVWLLV